MAPPCRRIRSRPFYLRGVLPDWARSQISELRTGSCPVGAFGSSWASVSQWHGGYSSQKISRRRSSSRSSRGRVESELTCPFGAAPRAPGGALRVISTEAAERPDMSEMSKDCRLFAEGARAVLVDQNDFGFWPVKLCLKKRMWRRPTSSSRTVRSVSRRAAELSFLDPRSR